MKNISTFFLVFIFPITVVWAQQPESPVQPQQPGTQQQDPAAQFPDGSAYRNSSLTYIIIDAPNNTFCYDVYVDGRLTIHQTSIPGLPGNNGFKTKDDAAKVAELVMYKIRNGEMPPTVTAEEMKNVGVKLD